MKNEVKRVIKVICCTVIFLAMMFASMFASIVAIINLPVAGQLALTFIIVVITLMFSGLYTRLIFIPFMDRKGIFNDK